MSAPITLRGVNRRFGDTLALSTVNLDIAPGQFVALIGPSGCGKTTLLRVVADLEAPSAGDIRIGDDPPGVARRKRMLGLVSQRPAVLPWKTAAQDVAFTQKVSGRVGFSVKALLADFGLAGHEDKYANELSGGMVQRVNFASAIAHDPQVLLMDEPFSALDEMKREELGQWLGEELGKRPKTVLFVTHHIDEAVLLADRILVFSKGPGRIVDDIVLATPRPRGPRFRNDPEFAAVTSRIRALLFGTGELAA